MLLTSSILSMYWVLLRNTCMYTVSKSYMYLSLASSSNLVFSCNTTAHAGGVVLAEPAAVISSPEPHLHLFPGALWKHKPSPVTFEPNNCAQTPGPSSKVNHLADTATSEPNNHTQSTPEDHIATFEPNNHTHLETTDSTSDPSPVAKRPRLVSNP